MATDTERLVAVLEARTASFEKALARANRQANTSSRKIERTFHRMNRNVTRGLKSLAAPLAAAFTFREASRLIDASIRVRNSLKVAGLEGDQLKKVYDSLYASANRNVAPMESLVELYSRASLVQNELGVTTEDLLKFTDKVAVALRVSGQSASESSGALLQLSQALGSGVVRAEEFNSVLEGALPIAQAAAAGLDEAGGSVAKLRQLVVNGKVSSEAFFKAFEAGSVILDEKVAGSEVTVSQAFVRLQNVLIDTAGKFNDGSKASQVFADALDDTGGYIEAFGNEMETAIPAIADFFGAIQGGFETLDSLKRKLDDALAGFREVTGLKDLNIAVSGSTVGKILGLRSRDAELLVNASIDAANESSVSALEQALQNYKPGSAPAKSAPTPATAEPGAATPASGGSNVQTVSLADYPVNGTSSGSGGRGSAAGAARKQADSIRKVIDNLAFEREQLARNADAQELYNELKQAGVTRESAYGQQIAAGVTALQAQRKAVEGNRQALEAMESAANDTWDKLIDGAFEGRDAISILTDAVKDMVKELLKAAGHNFISSIFGGAAAGGATGGLFGGVLIPGVLHSGGIAGRDGYGHARAMAASAFAGAPRYHKGTTAAGLRNDEVPAILQKGEVVLPRNAHSGPGALTVHVSLDSDLLNAVVTDTAGRVVAKASPQIVGTAVGQANKSAPSAVARYQREQSGGEYRL